LGWVALLGLLAVLADALPFERPHALPLNTPALLRPDLFSTHPLGTDSFGRDILSRVVFGARPSLIVGLVGALCALVFGGLLGLVAGYYRGTLESIIGVTTDSLLAFPPLVLLLALVAFLRPSLGTIIFALTLLTTPGISRVAKAATLGMSQREFVISAKALGASNHRVLMSEILPNIILPIASLAIVLIGALIVAEASLSFLGLGIKPPNPSWGNMIAEAQARFNTSPHTVLIPGISLLITVFAFNRIGDRVRGLVDSRQAKT
jgi:peptide/nickel transport system permease protein